MFDDADLGRAMGESAARQKQEDLDRRLAALEGFIPVSHALAQALANYVVLGNGKLTIGAPAVAEGRNALGRYQELIAILEAGK